MASGDIFSFWASTPVKCDSLYLSVCLSNVVTSNLPYDFASLMDLTRPVGFQFVQPSSCCEDRVTTSKLLTGRPGQFLFYKDAKVIKCRTDNFFNQQVWNNWLSAWRENPPFLPPNVHKNLPEMYYRPNSNWVLSPQTEKILLPTGRFSMSLGIWGCYKWGRAIGI